MMKKFLVVKSILHLFFEKIKNQRIGTNFLQILTSASSMWIYCIKVSVTSCIHFYIFGSHFRIFYRKTAKNFCWDFMSGNSNNSTEPTYQKRVLFEYHNFVASATKIRIDKQSVKHLYHNFAQIYILFAP